MNEKELAQKIYDLSEDSIYQILEKFGSNQHVDKSLVYCFTKAFYIHCVKLYLEKKKSHLDFNAFYLSYKETLKKYYKINNPSIEDGLLDQTLDFFDNSFGLISTVEISNIEDSYEFRHYTINVFELLRMILEKKSQSFIRENLFDKDIKVMIEETDKILNQIKFFKNP